jgi:hypothetical protein
MPEHIRAPTSRQVLKVETDITERLAARPRGKPGRAPLVAADDMDQLKVVASLAGSQDLVVIEGAAGAGKTTTLNATRAALDRQDQRMVVVTPTLKAAAVAARQVGSRAFSAAWLVHQHGWRWDEDARWTRLDSEPRAEAALRPGDLLLVDEAGMLDQDTARALLTIADEQGARIAFVCDRHQLPAVGRGGVLEQVADLNAAIRELRVVTGRVDDRRVVTTQAGERIGVGDRVATRRNDDGLGVPTATPGPSPESTRTGPFSSPVSTATGICRSPTPATTSSWPTAPPSTAPRARRQRRGTWR